MSKFSMQGNHKIKECEDCGELYCVECSDALDSDHFCSAKCANSNHQDNNWILLPRVKQPAEVQQ